MLQDLTYEEISWKSFVAKATVSTLLWLQYKPFNRLVLTNDNRPTIINHDFMLSNQIYEQVADSWFEQQEISQIYGFCDPQSELSIKGARSLEIICENGIYHIKLLGAWQHDISLCLWLSLADLELMYKQPYLVNKKIFWKFIQINIMLAGLINPEYLALLRGGSKSNDVYILQMILPDWEIKAKRSLKILKSQLLNVFKRIPLSSYKEYVFN